MGYLKMSKIITKSEEKIAREFFKIYNNVTTVTKKLYPTTKSKTLGIISRAFCKWRKKEYFYESHFVYTKTHKKGKNKDKEYTQAGPKFILNLNIMFDYLFEKGIKLSQGEKNYLNLLFSQTPLRKAVCESFRKDELGEAIIKFYLNFLVFPSVLKEEYIPQSNKISQDREFSSNMEKIFLESKDYRKEVKLAIKNRCKISNTERITKTCKDSLKFVSTNKIIDPIGYSRISVRPLYLMKQEDEKDGKFIKRLNMKMMRGFGIKTI